MAILLSSGTNPRTRFLLLGLLTLIAIAGMFMVKAIPQDPAYHAFAGKRTLLDIPNCMNVISNFPFFIVGIWGLLLLKKANVRKAVTIIYTILFAGVLLIGLGSAYYHYSPDNDTLVYDRIPMTIVFMSFLSDTVAEFIDFRIGICLLVPLLVTGIGSVLYWHYTEIKGAGDLRLYGLVQFNPVIFIPLILLLFPSAKYTKGSRPLIWVVVWYVIAKIFEHFDQQIYTLSGFISGHSLKHLAAAMSTWYFVKMFEAKYIVPDE